MLVRTGSAFECQAVQTAHVDKESQFQSSFNQQNVSSYRSRVEMADVPEEDIPVGAERNLL